MFSSPLLNLQGRQLHSKRLKGEVDKVLLQPGQWKPAEGGFGSQVFTEVHCSRFCATGQTGLCLEEPAEQ